LKQVRSIVQGRWIRDPLFDENVQEIVKKIKGYSGMNTLDPAVGADGGRNLFLFFQVWNRKGFLLQGFLFLVAHLVR